MKPNDYEYAAVTRVQCPKCGGMEEAPLISNAGYTLEYVAVCQSIVQPGGRCGTTLTLQVQAHLFPRASEADPGSLGD